MSEIVEMFTTGSFVKNYYLNLRFFDVLQSTLLKTNKKKCILKKDALHLNLLDITRDRGETLKKVKEKRKMRKKPNKNNDHFFTFTFLYRIIYHKSYFVDKAYLEKLSL